MKLVCVSDTHGFHREVVVPPGDVLVHAGDITGKGEIDVALDCAAWMAEQPHKHKIVVPGNHDFCFDISQTKYDARARDAFEALGVHFLIDTARTLDGIKFYGSPWVPNLNTWAFWDRGRDRFESAPCDIDVLVTHGPPAGVRDIAGAPGSTLRYTHCGSQHMVRYINRCPKLKLHIFGHVHESYGRSSPTNPIIFVNACICTGAYEPTNAPIVVEIDVQNGGADER